MWGGPIILSTLALASSSTDISQHLSIQFNNNSNKMKNNSSHPTTWNEKRNSMSKYESTNSRKPSFLEPFGASNAPPKNDSRLVQDCVTAVVHTMDKSAKNDCRIYKMDMTGSHDREEEVTEQWILDDRQFPVDVRDRVIHPRDQDRKIYNFCPHNRSPKVPHSEPQSTTFCDITNSHPQRREQLKGDPVSV
ncbi:hypothetical protein WN51_02604 [Melipona quadrifasciata]|uniref:Uncharacterized protein n=1 Tax=Melipona quadrifasciata TaxID=166423 RepID=A0A0N0BDR2_9HYME|nr:hypothetical protein WN51_02604 [Melipona quadrifasciata]